MIWAKKTFKVQFRILNKTLVFFLCRIMPEEAATRRMPNEEKVKAAQQRCADATQLNLKRQEVTNIYDKWANQYDAVS